jgi:hypothetical protein
VPRKEKYVPKHRGGASALAAQRAPRRALKTVAVLTILAAAVTGLTVSGGIFEPRTADSSQVSQGNDPDLAAAELAASRLATVSRSQPRSGTGKAALLAQPTGAAVTGTEDISDEDPRVIARALLTEFGFAQSEFGCLDSIYSQESGWRWNADNPRSSAYGIPQALPGSKMASAGADWRTNPVTQIRWGLGYIRDRYGSPCEAWAFKRVRGWY